MSLLLDGRSAASRLEGSQVPRFGCRPPSAWSRGADVVDLCDAVGVHLDPWQRLVLDYWLGVRDDGKWAAFEAGVVVPRQNGKGELLMARELASLYFDEWGERLVLHTAHEFKTSAESFLRIVTLIENSDLLRPEVKQIRRTTGEEGVEFKNGHRLRFLARSTSSGRGFTADVAIWDEAQILTDAPVRAMVPTMSARPNPQLVYAGTAGNELSVQLGAVRARAQKGDARSLAYLEWSVDEEDFDAEDPSDWAKANPAMGIRISADYISKEQAAMSADGFAAERLGVGDWPTEGGGRVIPADKWHACEDKRASRPTGPTVFAVDVDPERTRASIAVCGRRDDGQLSVELADSAPGLEWVLGRVAELDRKWQPVGWVVDVGGPAGTFGPALSGEVNVIEASYREVAQASEGFFDGIVDGSTRHTGDPRLGAAVAGGARRPCGDGWAWGRRVSSCDISPLVAASLARWGFLTKADELAPDDVYVG